MVSAILTSFIESPTPSLTCFRFASLARSGKSTQLPSFILEDQLAKGKPCKIYVTEPRRISAISLAQRVSQELGDSAGQVGSMSSLVGYSIRLESCVSKNTVSLPSLFNLAICELPADVFLRLFRCQRLAFVTNGIALRMLEGGTAPNGGKGTAFDEITVSLDASHPFGIDHR